MPDSAPHSGTQRSSDARGGGAAREPTLIASYPLAVGGTLLLVVGLGLLAFVAKVLDLGNGAILVIAFLGPLLAYLILTGQLSEFGAGGVNVKFREAARTPIDASVQLVTAEETQTITKLGPEEIGRIDALDPEAPVVLTLTLGAREGTYNFECSRTTSRSSDATRDSASLCSSITRVESLATYPARFLPGSLRHAQRPHRSWRPSTTVISHATEAFALSSSHPIRRPRKPLSRMTALQLDAMLVRDDRRMLMGIVEREDVLARLLLAAARG